MAFGDYRLGDTFHLDNIIRYFLDTFRLLSFIAAPRASFLPNKGGLCASGGTALPFSRQSGRSLSP
jgi:hypothetical protein